MFYSPILSFFRIFGILFWTFLCCSLQLVFIILPKKYFFVVPKVFFKGLVFLFGIKLKINGLPQKYKTIYISNHSSYIDIIILGSVLDALFVAKSEIASWPFINRVVKLGKTIFVNRKQSMRAKKQIEILDNNLNEGFNIIIFPEGTSNDGTKVLPFKSSLFAIQEKENKKDHYFQPTSITYTRLDGIPLNRMFKPFFAWYGDMDLVPHAWKFLGIGNCEIILNFHQPIEFSKFKSRKETSNICYNIISDQVASNLNAQYKEKCINLYNYKYL